MKELELVEENIAQACRKAGRDRSEVKIVAVTKTHGPEVVEEAYAAGLDIIGENKVQEAMWKKPQCNSRLSWHLIGHLQTNKVRQALATFDYIHSVDSARLLDKLQAVAEMENPVLPARHARLNGRDLETELELDWLARLAARTTDDIALSLDGIRLAHQTNHRLNIF